MAKVRVYELAKELNMDNKALVDKLQSSGLDVKNYMSTLDDAAIKKAREIVAGVVSGVVEEKRIKSTVIRRRKKLSEVETEPSKEAVKEEFEKEIIETPQPEIIVGKIKKPEIEAEAAAPPVKPEVLEEAGVKETVEEAVSAQEAEQGAIPAEKLEPAPIEEEKIIPESEPRIKQKKVRKKGDQPARIISIPDKDVSSAAQLKEIEEVLEKDVKAPPAVKVRGEAEADLELEKREAKKKKGRKKVETKEPDERGSFRRRKKEVYERADLYEDRGIARKTKKGGKRGVAEIRRGKQTEITIPKASKRRIKVPEIVTVAELAKSMGTKASELLKNLIRMGQMAQINQPLDFETAALAANEFGYDLVLDVFEEVSLIDEKEDRNEDLHFRPPVVTIMGHVDHGKTLLLDYIRKSNVVEGESGGITQHIGAYYVTGEKGDIVFLDTPGHEAFTAMRARGAEVTDIIVLVVAADDGVMPQTRESIDHARAANIPIVVAVNKMDKPEANPEKVKRDLSTVGVSSEDWGGDTLFGYVSAKTGEGVDELLNLVLLQAEMLELKANPNKPAKATVIEAKLDKNKGPVATVLVKNGTLHVGDHFICGEHYGRIRAMHNHRGDLMTEAAPSVPVEIHGISGVPKAGDSFFVVQDEKTAKQIAEHRKQTIKDKGLVKKGIVSLTDIYEKIKEGEVKELNIILKTDVQGSVEALGELLVKQSTDEVKLKIIHMATGTITESDVMLASASRAIIIGFNVRANPRVTDLAKKEMIDIRYYDVIYDAVRDVRSAMTGLLAPVYQEHVIGRAYIKEVFHVPKVGAVAGCQVSDGHIERNAKARLLRDDVVVFDGRISSLRRFKDDVKEVQSGYECGIGLENYNDLKPGDVFEVYLVEEVAAQL
jgi:translation initiation factor IF-2